MKIYTRQGDDGTTRLRGGVPVSKSSARVEAYGSVDELNSILGVAQAAEISPRLQRILESLQADLFRLGSDLADSAQPPSKSLLEDSHVGKIEGWIDELEDILPPLSNFILPSGCPAAASFHHARAVCRRSERRVKTLSEQEQINPIALPFLNRVGDLLFVLARVANLEQGTKDKIWKP